MVRRYIDAIFFRSPLILSLGGAAMSWNNIGRYQLAGLHVLESFLLVWLGYRAFQDVKFHFFQLEKGVALTALFTCFYFTGFPVSILCSVPIVFAYQMNHRWSLRRIPLIKNVAIASAWSCCTTALLFEPTKDAAALFAADWCLIFGLSLLTDIRDEHLDRGKLLTVVHILGRWPVCVISLGGIAAYYGFQMNAISAFCFIPELILVTAVMVACTIWATCFAAHRLATVSVDFSIVVFAVVAACA